MELVSMTREEIEARIAAFESELDRRTAVWEVQQRYEWAVRELARLAGHAGVIPASPVPSGGFMPGQVVDVGGTLYINGAGAYVDYAPGEEPISTWVMVEEPPTPDPDPEPEPEPPAPEHEEWEQRQAHNAYQLGDRVIREGVVYESLMNGNAWHVTEPTAWKRIDQ